MAETTILEALQAHFATLTTTPAMDKVNPRQRYRPTAGAPFLRAWLLPAQTRSNYLGAADTDEFRGVFQVDVMWPEAEDGLNEALAVAQAVVDHFAKVTLYRGGLTVRVITRPSIGPTFDDGGWSKTPVSISYVCLA